VSREDRFPNGKGRELAVLVGGLFNGFWYWRDDLENAQGAARDAGRRCSSKVPASKADYAPTEAWRVNPEKPLEQGREWRWTGGTA
jgi:hypothetical protein